MMVSLHRKPRVPFLAASVVAALLATGSCTDLPGETPSRASQPAEEPYSLVIESFAWEYDGKTINGVRAYGATLHTDDQNETPKLVRILMMPAGQNEGARIRMHTKVQPAPGGQHVAIDLRQGAALVDLGELDAQQRQEGIKLVMDAIDSRGASDLPGVSPDQLASYARYIREAAGLAGEAEPRLAMHDLEGERKQRAQEAAAQATFVFWPMIFSRTIVAGSESTRLIMVARPRNDGSPSVLVRLIEGQNMVFSYNSGTDFDDVGPNVDRRTDYAGGNATNVAPEPNDVQAIDDANKTLNAGWAAAFPEP